MNLLIIHFWIRFLPKAILSSCWLSEYSFWSLFSQCTWLSVEKKDVRDIAGIWNPRTSVRNALVSNVNVDNHLSFKRDIATFDSGGDRAHWMCVCGGLSQKCKVKAAWHRYTYWLDPMCHNIQPRSGLHSSAYYVLLKERRVSLY